jgi:hypothetical protein
MAELVSGARDSNRFAMLVAYSRDEYELAIGDRSSLVITADPKMFGVGAPSGRVVWLGHGDALAEARAYAEANGRAGSSSVFVLTPEVWDRIGAGLVWLFDHRAGPGERRRCSVGRLAFCVAGDVPAIERACIGAKLGSILAMHAGNPYQLRASESESIRGG